MSADTDQVFGPARGAIFEPNIANPIATFQPLIFTVDAGEIAFFERRPGTWSEEIAKRDHRDARRRAAS